MTVLWKQGLYNYKDPFSLSAQAWEHQGEDSTRWNLDCFSNKNEALMFADWSVKCGYSPNMEEKELKDPDEAPDAL